MNPFTVSDCVEISARVTESFPSRSIDPVDVYSIVRLLQAGDGRSAIGIYGDNAVLAVASVLPDRLLPEEVGS